MGINSKVAKIPFFILYLILAVFISYNWISFKEILRSLALSNLGIITYQVFLLTPWE